MKWVRRKLKVLYLFRVLENVVQNVYIYMHRLKALRRTTTKTIVLLNMLQSWTWFTEYYQCEFPKEMVN